MSGAILCTHVIPCYLPRFPHQPCRRILVNRSYAVTSFRYFVSLAFG